MPLPHRTDFLRSLAGAGALAFLLGASIASAQDVTDRLGLPGPVVYDGKSYELAWSANPQPNYFKQEYVQAGETPQSYTSMVLVEVLTTGIDVDQAVAAQVKMLNDRKPADPLVNMDVLKNQQTGEAILDFITSAQDDKGEVIVEWNAYRYAPRAAGGVTLFGLSHRAYGNDGAREFLTKLRELRPGQINMIAQHEMPKVEPTL